MSITEQKVLVWREEEAPSTAAFAWKGSGNDTFGITTDGALPHVSSDLARSLPML